MRSLHASAVAAIAATICLFWVYGNGAKKEVAAPLSFGPTLAINPTANPSTVNPMAAYFTEWELQGLGPSRNCASPEGTIESWGNGKSVFLEDGNFSSHTSWDGQCCPNGHVYGWSQKPLLSTKSLSRAFPNVNPFRFGALASVFTKNGTSNITVALHGDSTFTQLFFAMLCGAVRSHNKPLQVVRIQCHHNGGHTSHEMCTKEGRDGKFFSVTYGGGGHLKVHLNPPTIPRHTCDFAVINVGIHGKNRAGLQEKARALILASQNCTHIIWRTTQLQHFPPHGVYHKDIKKGGKCISITNTTQHLSTYVAPVTEVLERWPKIQEVSTLEEEKTLGDLFGQAISNEKIPDCTHMVYSPLYYDLVFERLLDKVRTVVD